FFVQAEDGIRYDLVTGVQTCALPIYNTYPIIITNLDGSTLTNQISSLGVVWYPMPAPTTNDLHSVGFFGNQFLLGGGNGTLLCRSEERRVGKECTVRRSAYRSDRE